MKESLANEPYEYVIIGGGISGLSSLMHLSKRVKNIICLEAGEKCGGFLSTKTDDGYTFDTGPNVFLKSYSNIYNLVSELGLEERIVYNDPLITKRYIYRNKTMIPVPEGPISLIKTPLLSVSTKLRLLFEPFIFSKMKKNETIKEFVKRRFGREISENLIDAVISGICAGDINHIEAKSIFPKLVEIEKKYRSILLYLAKYRKKNVTKNDKKEKGINFLSFDEGMGLIPTTIYNKFKNQIYLDTKVDSINKNGEIFIIKTRERNFSAKKIILATPAFEASKLLFNFERELSVELSKIPYVDMVTLALGFSKSSISHPLDGFGFLVPRKEKLKLLGAIFLSSLFPKRAPQGKVLIKLYMGGAYDGFILQKMDKDLIDDAINELNSILQIKGKPEFIKVQRIKNSIPQLNLGHAQIIENIRLILSKQKNIFLVGNYFEGVSINHAIISTDVLC